MVRIRSRAAGGAPRATRLTGALATLLILLAALLPAGPAGAQPVGDEDERHVQRATTVDSADARALAERFSPIVMVREQESACDDTGEPYLPVSVDMVLGNPDVVLRENAGGSRADDPVLVTAPEAEDLNAAGPDTYLDFPGNPRSPGCTYERWFKASMDGHEPSVHARVAETDAGHVVVQYHLFYVFNDFNNTHESDWEMAQLLFAGPTVADALGQEPSQVAFAQHGGGETADWDDAKLRREGDRIVVYASAGSHASQYTAATYLGWGANGTGFGCDNTEDPVVRVQPATVLLSASPGDGGEQAWLAWEGRWGERQPWEYNGPLGPATTGKWADPVGWQEGLRDSSLVVPGAATFGPGPTEVFCDLSEFGSVLLTRWAVAPWAVLGVALVPLAVLVGLLLMARRTIAAAFAVYRAHLRVFAVIGLLLIPIGIIANGFRYLIVSYPPGREIAAVMQFSPASDFAAALSVGGVQHLVSLLVVGPAVLVAYRDIERGEPATVRGTVAGIHERFMLVLRAVALPLAKVFLAALTVVGLPWAVDRSVRWSFAPHAVVLDAVPPEGAPDQSATVVRDRWWRTAGTQLVLSILGAAPGPVIGIILMVTMEAGVDFVNALSSLIYAMVLPFSLLGTAILYRRRQGRPLPAPAEGARASGAAAQPARA